MDHTGKNLQPELRINHIRTHLRIYSLNSYFDMFNDQAASVCKFNELIQ